MSTNPQDAELFHSFIHDLKTPMAAAKSAIDAATQFGPLTKRQEEMLQRATNNLERMERMIHDVLDFARLDVHDGIMHEECYLPRLLEDAALFVEDAARQRNVHLVVQVAEDARPILGDSHLLNHVFNNLLSNAIKYNHAGGDVTVIARNDGPMVRIDVRDTGVGIAPTDLDRIFDRFYRVKRRGERVDGTGLGPARPAKAAPSRLFCPPSSRLLSAWYCIPTSSMMRWMMIHRRSPIRARAIRRRMRTHDPF
jgi:signal transduction histidine kinase